MAETQSLAWSLDDLRAALGDDLIEARPGATAGFSALTNDSRVAQPGELFVALQTESRDGHDYVADAVARGASGVLVHRDVAVPEGVAVIRVRDTRHALGELARAWRSRYLLPAVVITGNVGKTTTKELTAALLGTTYKVLKSPANFNDEVGLSMTLFGLDETHQCIVVEVGMFELGEIARLCEIVRPDVGVVLNVGPTHLERLGSMEAIARAKAEAIEALPNSGTAILNADDPYVAEMASKTKARVLTFGIEKHADIRATNVESRGLEGVDFTISAVGRTINAHSPLPGVGLVSNALAAITVAFNAGMSIEDAAFALGNLPVTPRLQVRKTPAGVTILDDAYNAGPASMLAALGVLAETPGRHLALLGDMLELGTAEADAHREVGERAARVTDLLFTVGERGRLISHAAKAAGAEKVLHCDSKAVAVQAIRSVLKPGDVLLVKASHGLALHTVAAELISA